MGRNDPGRFLDKGAIDGVGCSQAKGALTHCCGADPTYLDSPAYTPGYRGGISGLVKNTLDYTEELKSDQRPYLQGRAVDCIATAAGTPGAEATLMALRSVVHALRGWPTPLGAAIVTANPVVDAVGDRLSARIETQLKVIALRVFDFAELQMKAASGDRRRMDVTFEQTA